jgi:PAS domain S-box-containing protein
VPRPLVVLIIEDSPDDAALLIRELERADFTVSWERVDTAAGLGAALTGREWDICVSDYTVPGFGASAALAIVRASHPQMPFIVVSGAIGEDTAVALMRAGADDYLLKDNLARLGAAVARAVDAAGTLRRSESRIEAILRGITDGVVTVDANGDIVYFSIGAEQIFGYTSAEAIGMPVGLLVPEPLRATHRAHEQQFTQPGGSARHTEHPAMLVGLRKSGEEFPIESVISRIDTGGASLATVVVRDISERLRIERALASQAEELARTYDALDLRQVELTTVIANAPVVLAAVDQDGVFTIFEGAGVTAIGLSPSVVVGTSALRAPAEIRDSVRRALGGERVRTVLAWNDRLFDADFVPIRREGAPITRAIIVATDITDRERALDRLRLLESAVAHSPDAIVITAGPIDGPSTIEFANPVFARISGVPDADAVGRSLHELRTVLKADVTGSSIVGALRGGEAVVTEGSIRRRDGTVVIVESHVAPILDREGRITHVVSVEHDVTQRQEALSHLRESEARFASYFSASPVPSLIERLADRAIVEVNEAALQLLGYERGEILGSDPYSLGLFADPAQVLRLARADGATASAGGPWQGELAIRRKHGELVQVMAYARPLASAADARVLIGFVDLTERDRVAALEGHQAVLVEAARVKAAFISSMNHELRTPLNAILGFSKLLLEQLDLSAKHRGYLDHIADAGDHLLELIGDVLDIARLESGKAVLRPETVGLAGLLEPVLAAGRLASETKGLTFTSASTDRLLLSVDPTRVRQILQNLVSNAVKFTTQGGRVAVRAHPEADAMVFEVVDSGIGISSEGQQRLFKPFERLHEGISPEKGTGLGLALVKELVELHRGTIEVESSSGQGSTFRVRLPGAVLDPAERVRRWLPPEGAAGGPVE